MKVRQCQNMPPKIPDDRTGATEKVNTSSFVDLLHESTPKYINRINFVREFVDAIFTHLSIVKFSFNTANLHNTFDIKDSLFVMLLTSTCRVCARTALEVREGQACALCFTTSVGTLTTQQTCHTHMHISSHQYTL